MHCLFSRRSCQIMDDPNITFLTKPKVCNIKSPNLLVMVLTAPKNLPQRKAIRDSIMEFNSNSNKGEFVHAVLSKITTIQFLCGICFKIDVCVFSVAVIRPLFLLGYTGGGLPDMQSDIDVEIETHQDILQSTLEEGYGKLSYKTNLGFVWTQW